MAETAGGWRAWLARLQDEGKLPTSGQALETMRDAVRRAVDSLDDPPPPLADVHDLTIPGPGGALPARLYTPLAAGVPPAPGLVFYHGGGFILGDLDTHDRLCRRLAARSHVRVLSVDYRLAPKHRFPAAVEDALAAFDWAAGEGAETLGFDPERIGVGGDSAGGTLAAVVAQERRRGRGAGPAPAVQILIYPLLQLADTASKRPKVIEGHLMSVAILERVRDAYLGSDDDPSDPLVSPLFRKDLAGVCPAFIVTAGLDPLRGEGRAYADMLAAAGVAVKTADFAVAPHGFAQMTAVLDDAYEAIDAAGRALAHALSR